MRAHRASSPWVVVALLMSAWPAAAQPPPGAPSASAEAEARYAEGLEALQAGDAARARDGFARAMELDARPEHALALAATLQELGEVSAAIGWYDRLLGGELGPIAPDRAASIREARSAARASQAVLHVTMSGTAGAAVEVDGAPAGALAPGASLTVRVDPGEHSVVVVVDEARTAPRAVTLERGEERTIAVRAPEPVSVAVVTTQPEPPERALDLGPVALMAVAAAPLGLGIGAAVAHREQLDRAEAAPSHREAFGPAGDAEVWGWVANVAFGVAGAVAVSALVWLLVELTASPERDQARLPAAVAW